MTYSSKERVLMAFARQSADRVPVYPVFTAYHGAQVAGIPYSEVALNPPLQNEIITKVGLEYGFDGLTLFACPPAKWRDDLDLVPGEVGCRYLVSRATGEKVTRIPDDDVPVPVNQEPPIQKEADLEKIKVPRMQDYLDNHQVDSVREAVKKYGDRGIYIRVMRIAIDELLNGNARVATGDDGFNRRT